MGGGLKRRLGSVRGHEDLSFFPGILLVPQAAF